MRVLMINVVCGIRSTGRICTDLAAALEAQGHEVKIAYGRENVPEQFEKYAVRIGTDLDVKFHGLRARLFDAAGFGSKKATERFIKWVKEWNPDVIHLHNIHGYYINVEVLFNYLKTCNKKVIWTLHDCWAFTGHSAYCDAVKCERWKTGCYRCPQINEYPKSLIDRSKENWMRKRNIFLGVADMTVITPSKWLGMWAKSSFLKVYPIKVVNNGIDANHFFPRVSDFRKRYNLERKFVLLGVATSWDEMKGFSDYLKLSEMLGDEFKIVLVGLSKKQIRKLPIKILGIERTANVKELAEIYSASDMFLNLSYCENYPTVNIEAMACGTPVLTYKTGGSPEIVEGNNGIVVGQGDLKAVFEAIESYKKSDVEKITINKDSYDNSRVIQNYLEIYNQGMR